MPLPYANLHVSFIASCCLCASPLLPKILSSHFLFLPYLIQHSPSLPPSLILLSVAAEIPFPVGQAKLNWRVYMNNRAVALIYLRVYA